MIRKGYPGFANWRKSPWRKYSSCRYERCHRQMASRDIRPEKPSHGQGFDLLSLDNQRGCIDKLLPHFFYWNGPKLHDLSKHETENLSRGTNFLEDLMVEEVSNSTQPSRILFFVYWAINMPPYPSSRTGKWLKHYKIFQAHAGNIWLFYPPWMSLEGMSWIIWSKTNRQIGEHYSSSSNLSHGHSVGRSEL